MIASVGSDSVPSLRPHQHSEKHPRRASQNILTHAGLRTMQDDTSIWNGKLSYHEPLILLRVFLTFPIGNFVRRVLSRHASGIHAKRRFENCEATLMSKRFSRRTSYGQQSSEHDIKFEHPRSARAIPPISAIRSGSSSSHYCRV